MGIKAVMEEKNNAERYLRTHASFLALLNIRLLYLFDCNTWIRSIQLYIVDVSNKLINANLISTTACSVSVKFHSFLSQDKAVHFNER